MRKKTIEVQELCYGNIVKHGDEIVRITEIQKEYCRVFNITKGRTMPKLIPITELTRFVPNNVMMRNMFGDPVINYGEHQYKVGGYYVNKNDGLVKNGFHLLQNYIQFIKGKPLKIKKLLK